MDFAETAPPASGADGRTRCRIPRPYTNVSDEVWTYSVSRLMGFGPYRPAEQDAFVVSLGLDEAYVELELDEALAYLQRREEYLNV